MHDLDALRLQIEWGADEAVLDTPVDRFAPAPKVADTAAPRVATAAPRAAMPSRRPAAPVADMAAAAENVAALHAALDASASPLRATASHTVRAAGNEQAGLILIGEAPGPEDDRSGEAYSGPAGQVLDRVLRSAGLTREALMLAFLVPWRPPGGRPPNEGEIAFCLPFMHRLLALTRPMLVVPMSGLALRALTGEANGIRRARGKWIPMVVPGMDTPIDALPMLPPELWLSNPASRSNTWADLLALRIRLDS